MSNPKSRAQDLYDLYGQEFKVWYIKTFPDAVVGEWEPVFDCGWFDVDIMQGAWNAWIVLEKNIKR
jgi:hypothetical protein